MKNFKKIKIKRTISTTSGITLIALVITIIVLLILAGVSISTLTGDNGILTRAYTSKKQVEEKQIEEQIKLAVVASKINDNHDLSIDTGILDSELKNNLGTGISINKKGTDEGLPWEVTKGDFTFEIKENGTIVAEDKEQTIPKIKEGDYITGYNLKKVTNQEIANLNNEVNSLSGYTSEQTLSQISDVQWRILELDDEGKITKLISADGVGNLGATGAKGYNNIVYLLNKKCETLYSGEQGTARSIKIEDLEEHYSTTGNTTKENYMTQDISKKRFTTKNYIYYPQMAKEEWGIGIDTETYVSEEDGKTYNVLNDNGTRLSDNGSIYEGDEELGGSYGQATTNGMTVTKTFYRLGDAESLSLQYENNTYYDLFHGVSGLYWIASRCVNTESQNASCNFIVRYASYDKLTGHFIYYSRNEGTSPNDAIRPIVILNSPMQPEYVGESSDSGYNTWNLQ